MPEIVVSTRNKGKLEEIRAILKNQEIKLLSLDDLPFKINEIHEHGNSFEENALIKARTVFKLSGKITMADDSGICVAALGMKPGLYSARYAGENATDRMNNEKLLGEMRGVPYERRGARFICVIALVAKSKELTVSGECDGLVLEEARGDKGFGYDPLFFYPPMNKTFGEMEPHEKKMVSHRGKALRELARALPEFLGNLRAG